MHYKLIALFGLLIISGTMGSAFAHTSEIVSKYKIEVGWDQEPPLVGVPNFVEIFVTEATQAELEEFLKGHEHAEGKEHGDETNGHDSHDHGAHEDDSHHSKTIEIEPHDHSAHDHGAPQTSFSHDIYGRNYVSTDITYEPYDIRDVYSRIIISEAPVEDRWAQSEIVSIGPEEDYSIILEGFLGEIQYITNQNDKKIISDYGAIRQISQILHANKANVEYTNLISEFNGIVLQANSGEQDNDIAMYKVKQLVDELASPIIEEMEQAVIEEPIGISGLANKLDVNVEVENSKTYLTLQENPDFAGHYVAEFTPTQAGDVKVNIFVGYIGDQEIIITLLPEDIEVGEIIQEEKPETTQDVVINQEIEMDAGICEEGFVLMKKAFDNTVACLSPDAAKKLEQRGWGTILS